MSTYRRLSNENMGPPRRHQPLSNNSTKTFGERVSDKVHAAFWVGGAISLARYVEFTSTLLTDPRIIRPLFNLAILCVGINTVLLLYLSVYLPKFKNIHNSNAWNIYCPKVIPTMTICGLVSMVLFIRSTWPVWGFLSPLILGVEFMGFLFSLHFIPWF